MFAAGVAVKSDEASRKGGGRIILTPSLGWLTQSTPSGLLR